MQPNPILKQLGFAPDDRLVILHADDIGMCHASVAAYVDLMDAGIMSSAAVMVPCPWFPLVADYCRRHPQIDMGVHLTLTSEWDAYRWGPVSTRDRASGLLDDAGYFYRSNDALRRYADPAAVQVEWEAQIQAALAGGIDVTHVDTHMLSAVYTAYLDGYADLARKYCLPMMFLRSSTAEQWLALSKDPDSARIASEQAPILEANGLPLIDAFDGASLKWDGVSDRMEAVKNSLAKLKPGITHFIFHPAVDSAELRAIAPDWRCRVSDYQIFIDESLRAFIQNQGIHVVNYRMLRDLMRESRE